MRVLIVVVMLLASAWARADGRTEQDRARDRTLARKSGLLELLGGQDARATSNVFGPGGLGTVLIAALDEIPKYQATDTPQQAEMRRAAAERRFKLIEPKFKAYEAMEYTGPLQLKAELVRFRRAKDDLEHDYAQLVADGDAGWAIAALARMVLLAEGACQKLVRAPRPRSQGIPDPEQDIPPLTVELPSCDDATGWESVQKRAQEFRVENEWAALARQRLAALHVRTPVRGSEAHQ